MIAFIVHEKISSSDDVCEWTHDPLHRSATTGDESLLREISSAWPRTVAVCAIRSVPRLGAFPSTTTPVATNVVDAYGYHERGYPGY
jgi:hypothetical protein